MKGLGLYTSLKSCNSPLIAENKLESCPDSYFPFFQPFLSTENWEYVEMVLISRFRPAVKRKFNGKSVVSTALVPVHRDKQQLWQGKWTVREETH